MKQLNVSSKEELEKIYKCRDCRSGYNQPSDDEPLPVVESSKMEGDKINPKTGKTFNLANREKWRKKKTGV